MTAVAGRYVAEYSDCISDEADWYHLLLYLIFYAADTCPLPIYAFAIVIKTSHDI